MRNTTMRIGSWILLILGMLSWDVAQAKEQSLPNIVIFLVDDMGVMDTSVPFLTDAAGAPKRYPLNDYYQTPNMERLAAQGIRFNNFYAMSVCSPTRVSIMTGHHAARHRVTNWINPQVNNSGPLGPPDWNWSGLKKSSLTLPKLLRERGYTTIHVGKGHFGAEGYEGANPLNIGFDVNLAGGAFGAPGSYYGQENYGHGGPRPHHAVPHLEKYHGSNTFLTDALTIETKALLETAVTADKPFFLYMAHYAVHAPFDSDPRFAGKYAASGKSSQAQAFATLVEGMDHSLGELMDHLKRLNVAENTLIFFLGDNGSDAPLGHQHEVACAAPLRGRKGSHYEGGARVPFIVAWGEISADSKLQQQLRIPIDVIQTQIASVCDLFPTITSIAGTQAPDTYTIDGRSLQRLLTGASDNEHSTRFLIHYPHAPHRTDYWTSLREGDWKVVYHYHPGEASGYSHYQLFNLKEDPFEQKDLSRTHQSELRRMMDLLILELDQFDAAYPLDSEAKQPLKPVSISP